MSVSERVPEPRVHATRASSFRSRFGLAFLKLAGADEIRFDSFKALKRTIISQFADCGSSLHGGFHASFFSIPSKLRSGQCGAGLL